MSIESVKTKPEFSHLTELENRYAGAASVAKNIRKDLKKHFPTTKFSVRKDGHNAIDISWTDGQTSSEVKELLGKFKTGSSSHCGDYMDNVHSSFSDVFGGVTYLWICRDFSDEKVLVAIKALKEEHENDDNDVTVEGYRNGSMQNISPICNFDGHHHWSWAAMLDRKLAES
ncbi:hypothetical protein VCHA53O466_320015 [Vibrio chagasii]|nr:hypothetical protein VCHA53O466_320015 [Vibrio chagasii]